ncbi:MAG: permease [Anaerolineales bacterium]|jgi:uncharacterized membrane protein YraQ (UPF0718 family)
MTTATVILWVIAAALFLFALAKKDGSYRRGAVQGWETLKRNFWVLVLAFIIVGFVNVLSPQNLVHKYLGPDSGWGGLFLAEAIGMLLPGGPYVVFPLIAVIYSQGAGLAPAVALVTGWAAVALLTVTFELPFMGWRFAAIRWGLGLLAPIIAGAVVMLFFS